MIVAIDHIFIHFDETGIYALFGWCSEICVSTIRYLTLIMKV